MMHELCLSWVTHRRGKVVGGNLPQPSWDDVEQHLEAVASAECGSVGLGIVNPAEVGPHSLDVLCGWGVFDVTLAETTTDDHVVRELNPAYATSTRRIPPTDWFLTNSLCEDFSLIKRIVREFFETGNVSRDLLS